MYKISYWLGIAISLCVLSACTKSISVPYESVPNDPMKARIIPWITG